MKCLYSAPVHICDLFSIYYAMFTLCPVLDRGAAWYGVLGVTRGTV